ncbi:MAG: glycosyltransferase family A protein [Kiritimatiellae bacterium]|nr:glycosyltransferase family A protein [Kiritimatiellia bacterium]
MTNAPIIVTVYDRLQHFQQCIEALQRNALASDSELYVVSDAPGKPEHTLKINQVRAYAQSITGFKKVHLIFRGENYGAYHSFLVVTQQVLSEHGRFIFLEDDVVASRNFLDYMNDGLNFYVADKKVFSITAYTFPIKFPKDFKADVFFLPSNCPWGFGTWKDRWEKVDFGAKDRYAVAMRDRKLYKKVISTGGYMMQILRNDSRGQVQAPDVRMAFHQFSHDVYTVYPRISKTINIGLDGSGLHSGTDKNNKYRVQSDTTVDKAVFDADVRLNPIIIKRVRNFQNGNLLNRLAISFSLAKSRWLNKNRAKCHIFKQGLEA